MRVKLRFHFLENTRHHHRFDGADMIDQPLGIAPVGPSAGKILFLQPQVGDLVVVRQMEMVIRRV